MTRGLIVDERSWVLDNVNILPAPLQISDSGKQIWDFSPWYDTSRYYKSSNIRKVNYHPEEARCWFSSSPPKPHFHFSKYQLQEPFSHIFFILSIICIQTNIEEEEEGRLSHKCQPAFIAPPLFSPDRACASLPPLANPTLPHLSNFLSFSIALSSFCWFSGGNCMRSILVLELLRLPHSSNTWSKIIGFTQWAACFIQIWSASH